jgi:hypothetical protein
MLIVAQDVVEATCAHERQDIAKKEPTMVAGSLSWVAQCDRSYFLNLALMTFSCSSGFSL